MHLNQPVRLREEAMAASSLGGECGRCGKARTTYPTLVRTPYCRDCFYLAGSCVMCDRNIAAHNRSGICAPCRNARKS